MDFVTVETIISRVAQETGISASALTDPYGSTDPNIIQMRTILIAVGERLSREHHWQHLQREHTFSTSGALQGLYDLPAGFRSMLEQTHWNRTSTFPLGGPVDAQEWQFLTAQGSSATFTVLFRTREKKIQVFPTSSTGQSIAFEYLSEYWVSTSGSADPTLASPTSKDHYIWFDPHLITRALKFFFLKEKGMATASSEQDYFAALQMAKADAISGKVLSLNGDSGTGFRLLDSSNVPPTNWGS